MSRRKMALGFLAMAEKDFRALRAMTDPVFAIEIFGFHAQQAVEKCLKAWVESLGGASPITHSLEAVPKRKRCHPSPSPSLRVGMTTILKPPPL